MSHKVVVTRDIGEEALGLLRTDPLCEVVLWTEDCSADRAWLLQNVSGAAGILVMLSDRVDEELLEKAGPSLKVVSTMSVGYEHVHLPSLALRGIKLGYTPDVLTDAVADIAVMLALMVSRNAAQGVETVSQGRWPTIGWAPFGFCGPQLGTRPATSGSFTAGFLGFGRIAQATLRRLIPFGITQAIYFNSGKGPSRLEEDRQLLERYRPLGCLEAIERVELNELASRSDVLFLLLPGGRATHHIVDESFLCKMKRRSILVNPGRGTLVDSDALAKALDEGWIYGAGLDVVEGEPHISTNHPLVKSSRAVILPHIGSATHETRAAMASLAAKNLLAGVQGHALPVEFKV